VDDSVPPGELNSLRELAGLVGQCRAEPLGVEVGQGAGELRVLRQRLVRAGDLV